MLVGCQNILRLNFQKLHGRLLNIILSYEHITFTLSIWVSELFNPFYSGYLHTDTLANSEDPDEMPHNVTDNITFMTEMHQNLECFTCDPSKCKMGNSILNLSTFLGKSTKMKRFNIMKEKNLLVNCNKLFKITMFSSA